MSLLLIAQNRDLNPLKEQLLELDSNLDVDIWPKVEYKGRVTFAVAWNHPKNIFNNYSNLNAVSSLGAGVNHLLNDESITSNIKLARLVTPSLKNEMAEYVLNAILAYRHHTCRYTDQKREAYWSKHEIIPKKNCSIGIMGLGEMGLSVGKLLLKHEYRVNGWSRSKKEIKGIYTYDKNGLHKFLAETNILVCLLPLTAQLMAFWISSYSRN